MISEKSGYTYAIFCSSCIKHILRITIHTLLSMKFMKL